MIRDLGRPGDLGWVVQAHGEMYAAEYGFDARFEALVARIVADYAAGHDPSRSAAWIAEVDGARAGCVFCVDAGDDDTAVLRILLVSPTARGLGLGGALVDTCLSFARKAGYQRNPRPPGAGPHGRVAGGDAGGAHGDPDLAGAGVRFGDVGDVEDRGVAVNRARLLAAVRALPATAGDLLLILAANAGVTATRAADRLDRSRRLADLALTGLGLSPAGLSPEG